METFFISIASSLRHHCCRLLYGAMLNNTSMTFLAKSWKSNDSSFGHLSEFDIRSSLAGGTETRSNFLKFQSIDPLSTLTDTFERMHATDNICMQVWSYYISMWMLHCQVKMVHCPN